MPEAIFSDKNHQPTEEDIRRMLSGSFQYYREIKDFIHSRFNETREEWKFYGKKYGWQLKIFHKKRNLLFLVPDHSFFKTGLVFGDKAVEKIEGSSIHDNLKQQLRTAKKYGEGRGISIAVKDDTFVEDIKRLIEIKDAN